MDITLIVMGALAVLVGIFVITGVRIVPQAELQVIERLGRYHRVLEGGLNFIIPFVDRVRDRFSTQEQTIDIPSQSVITKDNVTITIDGIVFIRVHDGRQAAYEVKNLNYAIGQLAQTTMRSEIGKLELDETLSSREDMNASLLSALDAASEGWGAKVTRVEISDISVPQGVQRSMEQQMEATRDRRATEERAQADKNATIAKAEGDRQEAFLQAEAVERMAQAKMEEQAKFGEGEQKAIEAVAQAITQNPQSAEYLLSKDRIQAWTGIASSDSQNKVVVPYEANELIGSLSVMSSVVGNQFGQGQGAGTKSQDGN